MKKYHFYILLASLFMSSCLLKPEMWGDVKIVPYDLADFEISNKYANPEVREKLDTVNNIVYKDTTFWSFNFIFEGNLKIDSLVIKNHVINFVDTFHYPQGYKCSGDVRIYKTTLFTDKTVKGIDGNIQEDILVDIDYQEGSPNVIMIRMSNHNVVYYAFRYYNQNKRIPKKGYYWLEKS